MPGVIFYYVLNMSILGVLVMVIVWLFRALLKKWLPKNLVLLLWVLVAIRLVVPVAIDSEFSIVTVLADSFIKTVQVSMPEFPFAPKVMMMNSIQLAKAYAPFAFKSARVATLFNWLGVLWLSGVIVVGAVLACGAFKFRTKLNKSFYKTYRGVDVIKSSKVYSPLAVGIINPQIVLPTNGSDEIERFVMMHEYAHIRRKDNLWKLSIVLIALIHWFNPLAWWMVRQFSKDVELACDESVIKHLSRKSQRDYAIALVEANRQMKSYLTAFSGTALKQRINAIVFYQRISLWMMIALVILYSLLAIGLLTA